MNRLPWFQENVNQWLSLIDSQQAPHAILLNGSKGLGKYELALQMAQIALCENLSESGVCNQCSPCELYKVGNHPDLTIISADKSVIKVEQIRKLSKDIRLSSTKGQYRVVIIKNAEKMNKASANALLKTLEEPPEQVVIILTTSEMGRLLPTIKSRCVKLNCALPSRAMAIDWLSANAPNSPSEIDHSLWLVNGSPFAAMEALKNNALDSVKVMLLDLEELLTHSKSVVEVSKKWYSDELIVNIPLLANHFLNEIKFKNGLLSHENMNGLGVPLAVSKITNPEVKLLTFVKNLYQFSYRLETALKKELLLEELLIHWKSDFRAALY